MLPIFVGLIMAMLTGFAGLALYGDSGVGAHAWVSNVFWGFIISGAVISALQPYWGCLSCQATSFLSVTNRIRVYFCANKPCVG